MKKTGFVWFIIIIGALNSLLGMFVVYPSIIEAVSEKTSLLIVLNLIVSIISIATWLIYLYELLFMKYGALRWTNIAFGFDIFTIIFAIVTTSVFVEFELIVGVAWIILWIFTYRHLNKTFSKTTILNS